MEYNDDIMFIQYCLPTQSPLVLSLFQLFIPLGSTAVGIVFVVRDGTHILKTTVLL